MKPIPDGVGEGTTTGTIRHFACQHCGRSNEVRIVGMVPADYYNAVKEYVIAAAGNEFVLVPASTLNQLGAELEALRRASDPT